MSFEEALEETQRAFEEAGVEDADLSYLTREEYDQAFAEAHDLTGDLPDDLRAELDANPEASNYLYNCWFHWPYVTGSLANTSTWSCASNWRLTQRFSSRIVHRRCANNSSVYIWRVS